MPIFGSERRKNEKKTHSLSDLTFVPNFAGIYLIRCIVNDCKYVGQASHLRNRLNSHKGALKRGNHYSRKMQGDYLKYGEDAFEVYVLTRAKRDTLVEDEAYWIKRFRPEYNTMPAVMQSNKKTGLFHEELIGLELNYKPLPWHRIVYGSGRH